MNQALANQPCLQLADEAIKRGRDTLYVAGEESPGQVKMSGALLNVSNELKLTRETAAEVIAEHIRQEKT
ncbi:MAG: hypothetical protein R2865_05445 [Deinococcales bacterium]